MSIIKKIISKREINVLLQENTRWQVRRWREGYGTAINTTDLIQIDKCQSFVDTEREHVVQVFMSRKKKTIYKEHN